MRRNARAVTGVLLLLGLTFWTAPLASALPAHARFNGRLTWSGPPLRAVTPTAGSVTYAAAAHVARSRQQLAAESAAGTTVPTWSGSVVAGQNGDTYDYTMVGSNVFSTNSTTTVQAILIPLIVTFAATGDVYNPTTADSACSEPESALTGELNSPEFVRRPWYAGKTFVGDAQYTDAQMREEFWDRTNPSGSSPDWNLNLNVSLGPTFSIEAASEYPELAPGTCEALGEIDMASWEDFLQGTIFPDLFADGIGGPTTLPIFLVQNVVLTNDDGKSCCVFGFHTDFDNPSYATNTQTYAWTDYQMNDDRPGLGQNVTGTSHELAEWANDPFVNNPTPSWGHTGQDPHSCQGNLEVGDPLTTSHFTVQPTRPGGMVYNLQELAFMGWFFDQNFGVNGWYSDRDTFTTGSTICST
jgi:hypothetical protein